MSKKTSEKEIRGEQLDLLDVSPDLAKLFNQCTEGQQRKFIRIFGSVETMNPDKIASAIALCERTIKNNQAT